MIGASSVRPGDRNSNFPHHATTKTLESPGRLLRVGKLAFQRCP